MSKPPAPKPSATAHDTAATATEAPAEAPAEPAVPDSGAVDRQRAGQTLRFAPTARPEEQPTATEEQSTATEDSPAVPRGAHVGDDVTYWDPELGDVSAMVVRLYRDRPGVADLATQDRHGRSVVHIEVPHGPGQSSRWAWPDEVPPPPPVTPTGADLIRQAIAERRRVPRIGDLVTYQFNDNAGPDGMAYSSRVVGLHARVVAVHDPSTIELEVIEPPDPGDPLSKPRVISLNQTGRGTPVRYGVPGEGGSWMYVDEVAPGHRFPTRRWTDRPPVECPVCHTSVPTLHSIRTGPRDESLEKEVWACPACVDRATESVKPRPKPTTESDRS